MRGSESGVRLLSPPSVDLDLPPLPKKRLHPTSFEMALIEDIIVSVGEFHGQERETLSEMDGEMRSEGRQERTAN